MFSGLYGDLPQAKDEAEKKPETTPGAWSGSTLLVPSAKRAAVAMPPPSVMLRGTTSRGRGRDASVRGRGRYNTTNSTPGSKPSAFDQDEATHSNLASSSHDQQQNNPAAHTAPQTTATAASIFGDDIHDEYDAARPNDYDAIRRRIEQQRLEAEAESERQERLREIRELEDLERRRDEEEQATRVGYTNNNSATIPPTLVQHSHTSSMLDIDEEGKEEARKAALQMSGEEA